MLHACYNMTWAPAFRPIARGYLALAIPALIFHVLFWLQVATHRSLRQLSMLWVYNYLVADMLLLIQFLVEYFLRTSLPFCISSKLYWTFCSLEAYAPIFFTILEAYMLVGLNITRYYLIVKNLDIATRFPYIFVLISVFLYFAGAGLLIFQVELFGIVTLHKHQHTSSCHLQYRNIITQLVNLIIVLLIPILLNCYFVTLTTVHVRRSQRAVRARHSKHLQLLVQFFVLYILWLALWAPNAFVSHIVADNYPSIYTRFGSITCTLIGPLIFMFIDRRFLKVWKHTLYRVIRCDRPVSQIRPSTVSYDIHLPTMIR
ncbi:unnamed protein product [Adineta ricciae]|uniref:G-protein coupled receptors family 1 profile domain-containing protein n=1 Tax=Adineta ricciae TaxID=249248 RepID=A0A814ZM18_ADIRI|nr:unnamed protein product [Adineta ricciae]